MVDFQHWIRSWKKNVAEIRLNHWSLGVRDNVGVVEGERERGWLPSLTESSGPAMPFDISSPAFYKRAFGTTVHIAERENVRGGSSTPTLTSYGYWELREDSRHSTRIAVRKKKKGRRIIQSGHLAAVEGVAGWTANLSTTT